MIFISAKDIEKMTFTHKIIIFRNILNKQNKTENNEIKYLNLLNKFNWEMKKLVKITFSVLIVLIVTIIAVPYFLKDDIEQFIKEEINNQVNAQIDYQDLSLSLLSDFPNLHVKINNFTIDGINEFKQVRLAQIDELTTSLDLKKILFGKDLEIKKVGINGADLNIQVLKNGKANYDIVKPDSISSTNQKTSNYAIKIEKYHISDANLLYDDASLDMHMKIKKLNQTGTGVFTADAYNLTTQTTADTLDVIYDHIHYINNAHTKIDTDILIENDFNKYTITGAQILLNDLPLKSNMMFELKGEDIDMDIDYETQDSNLSKLLSLVPQYYMPDIKNLKTNGTAHLKGFVNGTYNEQNFPAYGVDFDVKNGQIKYPDLPQSVEKINVTTKINFPGGNDLDQTEINIPELHFDIAGSSTDGQLLLRNPMTDPYIDTRLKSNMDLSKIKEALQLPGIKKLTGLLDADFKLKGRSSAIEQQKFNQFDASGYFKLDKMLFASDSIDYSIDIDKAEMNITPKALDVKQLDLKVGESDFHMKGNIENYITYFLKKDQILKADFNMHSNYVNMNQFMTDNKTESNDSIATGTIKIPKNLDIRFSADADKMLYKDLHLNNVKGKIDIKDEKASLETVLLKTLGGDMTLKGIYDTSQELVQSAMDLSMQKISLSESAQSLTMFKTYTPVMKALNGYFFSDMNLKVDLDEQMNPVLSTMDASGLFKTGNIEIGGIDVIKKIGELLKLNELQKAKVDDVKAQFEIKKGKLFIKPFNFKINNIESGFEGNVSLDQKIDLKFQMNIPRQMLGNKANEILENLVGKLGKFGLSSKLDEIIKMDFKITGDYNNPKIIPVIAGVEGNSTEEVVSQVVEEKVDEVVEDTKEKAHEEAQEKADAILTEAQAQADKIKEEAKKAADKIREEAAKQADEIIKKAGNDPFKKLAAEALAKKVKKEAEKKAQAIETEAQNKADLIMKNAQKQANDILKNLE